MVFIKLTKKFWGGPLVSPKNILVKILGGARAPLAHSVLPSLITSGLALGLLSFSQVDLKVLIKSGQFHDQRNAGCFLILYKLNHFSHCFLESLFLFLNNSSRVHCYN